MPQVFGFDIQAPGFTDTVVNLVSRSIIETLRAGLPHLPKGAVIPATQLPGHNGTFVYAAYPDLAPDTTSLTEGTPPAAKLLGIDSVSFSAAQKGNYVKVTDLAQMQSPHNLATVAAGKIQRQMVETADELARLVWATHTTDIFSGSSNAATADLAAGDYLSAANVMDAVAVLRSKDVAPLGGGDYLAIAHPFALRGLATDKRFVAAAQYGDPSRLFKGSIGGFEGCQFVPSGRATTKAGTGITVFATTVIGGQSIAFGDIGTLQVIVEHGGVSDPLHQLDTVGWKAFLGGCLVKVSETTDGAGTNGSAVDRVVTIESASGIGATGA